MSENERFVPFWSRFQLTTRPSKECDLSEWEAKFEALISSKMKQDPAHDLAHVRRVVKMAKRLAESEKANIFVCTAAAWLHDLVNLPKNDPLSKRSSRMAAEEAKLFLEQHQFPSELIAQVGHAIAAHSFSAAIPCETLEAKIVQDSDRLDAIGAIGVARVFAVSGMLDRPLYRFDDPFAEHHPLDDKQYALDHFYVKLLKLKDSLQTESGRAEGERRSKFLVDYIEQLRSEIM